LLGTDQVAYLEWWIDQVAVANGDGLSGHAKLLAKVDARKFVEDIRVPMSILAATKSGMAPARWTRCQRELQAKVKGSKLVPIDGAGHEIYVDRAEECKRRIWDFWEH
jgi:pimeloyl-ACP methyl ester carboxylesterase